MTSTDDIWALVDKNAHDVAVAHELITADKTFALTPDQASAVEAITAGLAEGHTEYLLKAPTGSGKTEVLLRVAITEALRSKSYVTILAPTRELVRQDARYFRERLEGTGLGVVEYHGGIAPKERRQIADGLADGTISFIVGSAMMLASEEPWDMIDRGALTIIDDVNAFDEREHLSLLEGLDSPLVFASATPNELKTFLTRVGAYGNMITMKGMPFETIPTQIHKIEGVWGEPPIEQLLRAEPMIREHLDRRSRIFVIGRTRGDVPSLAMRLENLFGMPVQQMRGDMADTAEHGRRARKRKDSGSRGGSKPVAGGATRIEMMRAFLEQTPSILAATNLVGSGLDIPAADLIVVTDADSFGEGEIEQLIGRVGRRERPSDAVLITHTTLTGGGRSAKSKRLTFSPPGRRARSLKFRR